MGLAAALAALAHPLLLALAPAAAVHGAVNGVGRRALLALALGTAIGLAPATLHNLATSGDLVIVCSSGGQNLYIGNHAKNATGAYLRPGFAQAELSYEESDFAQEARRVTGTTLSPAETSRFWAARALADIAAAPALSIHRVVSRLRWAVGDKELIDGRAPEFYRARSPVLRLPLPTFGFIAMLGLLGGLVGIRDRRLAGLSVFVLLFVAALALFFVFGRLRLPLLVPLAILAGAGLPRLVGWIVARDRRAGWAALLVPIGVLVFVGPPAGYRDTFTDHFNQAVRLQQEGRLGAAVAEYRAALASRPLAVVHFYLAEALSQLGDTRGANAHYDEAWSAARKQGADPLVYLGLARARTSQGRPGEAQEILSQGIKAHPGSADLLTNLGSQEAQQGNLALARGHWERALAIDPFAPLALGNLALLHQTEGRESDAAKLYRRFLDATKAGEYPEIRARALKSTVRW